MFAAAIFLLFSLSSVHLQDFVTWQIMNDTVPEYYETIVDKAFRLWEEKTFYTFKQIIADDDFLPDIRVYFLEHENGSRLGFEADGDVFVNVNQIHDNQTFYLVVAHEIGHALHLDHVNDSFSIMYHMANRYLDWNESLPLVDVLHFQKTHARRVRCAKSVDAVSRITPYTWLAFYKDRFYRKDAYGNYSEEAWGYFRDLFPFPMNDRVDAFFRYRNGSYAVISGDDYYVYDYNKDGVVPAKRSVRLDFQIQEQIVAASFLNRSHILFLTANDAYVFGYDEGTVRSVRFEPFPKNALGVFVDHEFTIVIVDEQELVYYAGRHVHSSRFVNDWIHRCASRQYFSFQETTLPLNVTVLIGITLLLVLSK